MIHPTNYEKTLTDIRFSGIVSQTQKKKKKQMYSKKINDSNHLCGTRGGRREESVHDLYYNYLDQNYAPSSATIYMHGIYSH